MSTLSGKFNSVLALSPLLLLAAADLRAQPAVVTEATPISIGTTLEIASDHLGETRSVDVYLPPSYEVGNTRYPVLYVLDGEMAFLHTASAAQFLARLGQIPEMIVVAIPNTNRSRDMPIPEGYGRRGEAHFLAFLADELLPLVDARFRTHPLRLLSGHSQGGLFAVYAMVTRPEVFQWYLVIDTPLLGPVAYLKDEVHSRVRHPGYTGRLVSVERTLGWRDDWQRLEALDAPGFRRYRIEVARETETHETMTYAGTYEGLRRLFSDYEPDDLTTKTLDVLEAEYAALSALYGYPLPISKRLLLRNLDDLLFQTRADEAEALLGYYLRRYGSSDVTDDYARRLQAVRREGPLDETVADILAYPRPDTEAMRPYLGTWSGRLYASDGHGVPVALTVTFEIHEEAVIGHTTLTFPDGTPHRLENVMIRLLPDGTLEWGYMNQTRPRGVIVTQGRFPSSNSFVGTQEMRGVRIQVPPGLSMSTWHVELTRKD